MTGHDGWDTDMSVLCARTNANTGWGSVVMLGEQMLFTGRLWGLRLSMLCWKVG